MEERQDCCTKDHSIRDIVTIRQISQASNHDVLRQLAEPEEEAGTEERGANISSADQTQDPINHEQYEDQTCAGVQLCNYLTTYIENNVASFFTPASQKPPERTTWRTVSNSLLVAQYQPQDQPDADRRRQKRSKVAALDLDSTIVTSASGKKFARDATDWKWWHACVPGELRKLDQDG